MADTFEQVKKIIVELLAVDPAKVTKLVSGRIWRRIPLTWWN